jgi:DNA ligase 1
MISALARAVVYSPPNTILTLKPVLNSKKEKGEEWFLEECARVEYSIKEAACEFPNYGAIVNSLLVNGTDTKALALNCHMRVGIPLKPMLAKPTKGV